MLAHAVPWLPCLQPLKTKAVPLGPLTGLAALRKSRASAAPAVSGWAQGPAEGQASGLAGLATPGEPQQEQPQSPVAAGVLQRIKQESPRGLPALHMQTGQSEAPGASPKGSPVRLPAKAGFSSPPLSPSKVAAQDAAAAASAAVAAAARAADALSTAVKLRSPRSGGPASPGAAQTVSFEQAPHMMQAPAHAGQHQAQVLAKQQQQQVGVDPAMLQHLLAMGQLRPLVGNPGAILSLLSLPQAQQAAVQGLPGLLPGLQPALALQSIPGQQPGLALPGRSMPSSVLESQGMMALNWQDRLQQQQQQQLLVSAAGVASGPQQLVPASLAAFTSGMPLNLSPLSFQQHLAGFRPAEQQPGAGPLHQPT